MTASEDEDESLVQFLESEVASENSDQEAKSEKEVAEEERMSKRQRVEYDALSASNRLNSNETSMINPRRIEGGVFSRVPHDIFPHILKFLSSEDLVSCSLVCRYLNFTAADESLWRRLTLPTRKRSYVT